LQVSNLETENMSEFLMPPIDAKSAAILASPTAEASRRRLSALDLRMDSRPNVDQLIEEFQGIFLNEMMKAMRSTVPESPLFEDQGMAQEMFQSFLDEEYVHSAGRQMGVLGLTEALKRQLGLLDDTHPSRETQGNERTGAPAGGAALPVGIRDQVGAAQSLTKGDGHTAG
jgi:Rod binding domain-containing protein